MTKSTSSLVATCPDCGGILQPVALERLTSSEVASAERRRRCTCSACSAATKKTALDDEAVLPA